MQRRFRLRRIQDFARLRQAGRVYRRPTMLMSIAPNNQGHNRYGFVTSKHLGKAVVRNRLRRLLREAVRQQHSRLRPGYDVVIVARPAIVGKSFQVVADDLLELFCQADLVEEDRR